MKMWKMFLKFHSEFVADYACTNKAVSSYKLRDSSRSFPSGKMKLKNLKFKLFSIENFSAQVTLQFRSTRLCFWFGICTVAYRSSSRFSWFLSCKACSWCGLAFAALVAWPITGITGMMSSVVLYLASSSPSTRAILYRRSFTSTDRSPRLYVRMARLLTTTDEAFDVCYQRLVQKKS